MEDKVREYCERLGVEYSSVMSKSRESYINDRRQVIWYILRKREKYKIQEIELFFGKSRPTIIHGVGRVSDFLDIKDEKMLEIVKVFDM
ncbi:chromosomal replication initiation ATPase DnaA [Parabacteroides sp. PF5-5]|uniref:helix-turn-helix domain-containing protein n=1 Tax=unclassified Parabacteroides TaxID=2649774 RepID=UPI00247426E3|nr:MULTISPECIES: helix-turn-helix domain-containing protein [unclassified Parabacteroides]MDH6304623.1 chromosomal replication initiation ATPase DnaA [Parabacteroides sp. PH5-39]MDH6315764.1 chromosomal replication initiation ATPase DnaA [Parabacteroides sp. PF5-13]MDH6319423.1 chromosomal replication initiation ATPase DnaA [Parabacteroides sp. PH5-13]MDH6323154.1 chromosomal replication initiation ATPase DnaA [Parabacteroides sp. PH5-8]MDH6326956.1 chromosomal replication initiation ATPase Dn